MSNELTLKRRVYMDIDALLDSKMGTMTLLDPPSAAMVSVKYWKTRNSDYLDSWNLPYTKERYIGEYSRRNIQTLKMSTSTMIMDYIKQIIVDDSAELSIKSKSATYELTIIIPKRYVLSDLDREMLCDIVISKYPGLFLSVDTRSSYTDTVHPQILRSQSVDIYVCFDDKQWLDQYGTSLTNECGIPDITVFVPKILRGNGVNRDTLSKEAIELYDNGMCPYHAVELLVSEYATLRYIDVKYYSTHISV